MRARTRETSGGSAAVLERPKRSRKQSLRSAGNKRRYGEETTAQSERVLREQVTYMLWIMAQLVD